MSNKQRSNNQDCSVLSKLAHYIRVLRIKLEKCIMCCIEVTEKPVPILKLDLKLFPDRPNGK